MSKTIANVLNLHIWYFIAIFCLTGMAWGANTWADEVLMTTGERFSTSRVWEEDGDILFNMHGLVVKVNKSDVARIITGSSDDDEISYPNASAWLTESSNPTASTPPATAQSAQLSDVPHPFDDVQPTRAIGPDLEQINWQIAPETIPGLKLLETDPAFGGVDQYFQPGQPLMIGKAPLNGWVYGFWRGQLYSIMLWVDGKTGYETLRKEVFRRFGPGKASQSVRNLYVWDEHVTQRMLQFDTSLNTAIFVMRSSHLDLQIKTLYP